MFYIIFIEQKKPTHFSVSKSSRIIDQLFRFRVIFV